MTGRNSKSNAYSIAIGIVALANLSLSWAPAAMACNGMMTAAPAATMMTPPAAPTPPVDAGRMSLPPVVVPTDVTNKTFGINKNDQSTEDEAFFDEELVYEERSKVWDEKEKQSQQARDDLSKKMDKVADRSGQNGKHDSTTKSLGLDDNLKPEGGKIGFNDNHYDMPVYEITVDADGNVVSEGQTPTGNVAQTMKGLTPEGATDSRCTYGTDSNGGRYIERVDVKDANGTVRASARFGPDGLPTQGQTWNADGKCTGGFVSQ